MNKKSSRIRRAKKSRSRIKDQNAHRLSVHRTPKHIYAQVITPDGGSVIASASSIDKSIRVDVKNGGNVSAAVVVGNAIAEKAKAAGITKVAFDRSGYKYHGRVKALADSAREGGLEF